jgi:hypothetical protein
VGSVASLPQDSYNPVMIATQLPVFEPTPSSVAAIATRLPASQRAHIEWFPQELRRTFIEPLAQASRSEFHTRFDELTVDAVRAMLRLFADLGALTAMLDPGAVMQALEQDAPRRTWDDLIRERLEPIDATAADDLREACEWLRAILATTVVTLGPAVQQLEVVEVTPAVQALHALGNADIQRALRGEIRTFFRGLLLTIAALDTLERALPPEAIVEWCALARTELHATANMFRASGMPVPTNISIPGYSPVAWREHRYPQGTCVAPALLTDHLALARAELIGNLSPR